MTAVSVTNWKSVPETAAVVHRTGFSVSFVQKPFPRIAEISGIEALSGTEWAGKAGVLTEEALRIWVKYRRG